MVWPASAPRRSASVSVPVARTPSWRPGMSSGREVRRGRGRPRTLRLRGPAAPGQCDVRLQDVDDVAGNELVRRAPFHRDSTWTIATPRAFDATCGTSSSPLSGATKFRGCCGGAAATAADQAKDRRQCERDAERAEQDEPSHRVSFSGASGRAARPRVRTPEVSQPAHHPLPIDSASDARRRCRHRLPAALLSFLVAGCVMAPPEPVRFVLGVRPIRRLPPPRPWSRPRRRPCPRSTCRSRS